MRRWPKGHLLVSGIVVAIGLSSSLVSIRERERERERERGITVSRWIAKVDMVEGSWVCQWCSNSHGYVIACLDERERECVCVCDMPLCLAAALEPQLHFRWVKVVTMHGS